MKIHFSSPTGPYKADLDTGVMDVKIEDAFIGPVFVNGSAHLSVFARDHGFEFKFWTNTEEPLREFSVDETGILIHSISIQGEPNEKES